SSSYNSDTIALSSKDELNELNELNESNELNKSNELDTSNILENIHNLENESSLSSPDQTSSHNSSVTVTNNKVAKKICCKVEITNEDGIKKACAHEYESTTGTDNLKAHLCQLHRILPSEENNNNNQLAKTVSNQPSLHDFINKKTLLPISKQDKITNCILSWIVDDLQPFNAITNNCFRDMILESTSQVVKACCSKINQSMLSRWFEPSSHCLIAAFLDPRLKKINYITPSKKRETIAHLYTLFDTQEQPSSIQEPQTSNT
ncbi:40154_t:CDS:2, partial [Gigaspora margarita]